MTKDEKIAYYEDMLGITEDRARYERLRDAYGMSPGATSLLSRLIAARGRWLPKDVLLEAIPADDTAKDRDAANNVKVRMAEIRKALGQTAVENERVLGYRLSREAQYAVVEGRRVEAIIQIIPTVDANTAARIVHSALNDPNTLPIDAMRIHGAWRAQGG